MTLSAGFLLTSTLLCALVTDEVIQNNQPIFMIVWMGSVVSVIGTMITAFIAPYSIQTALVIMTGFVYLLGLQGLTVFVHSPLNRRIQGVSVADTDPSALREQRMRFEARWIRFNWIRSLIGLGVILSFMATLSLNTRLMAA